MLWECSCERLFKKYPTVLIDVFEHRSKGFIVCRLQCHVSDVDLKNLVRVFSQQRCVDFWILFTTFADENKFSLRAGVQNPLNRFWLGFGTLLKQVEKRLVTESYGFQVQR
jgi:hypothetical protein